MGGSQGGRGGLEGTLHPVVTSHRARQQRAHALLVDYGCALIGLERRVVRPRQHLESGRSVVCPAGSPWPHRGVVLCVVLFPVVMVPQGVSVGRPWWSSGNRPYLSFPPKARPEGFGRPGPGRVGSRQPFVSVHAGVRGCGTCILVGIKDRPQTGFPINNSALVEGGRGR